MKVLVTLKALFPPSAATAPAAAVRCRIADHSGALTPSGSSESRADPVHPGRPTSRGGAHRASCVAVLAMLIAGAMVAVSPRASGLGMPTCGGSPATIVGSNADDVIVGTEGDDVIVGLKGDDRIVGDDGADLICGGSGRDELLGGRGKDTIFGGPGGDQISGGPGDDLLLGGRGRDTMEGGRGTDSLYGGPHSDLLRGWEESDEGRKHLFVLSGQSNMVRHRPQEAFIPAVNHALGKENVIVVQDALGGQPIRRWYKEWRSPDGTKPETTGDLYERLMDKVNLAITGQELASVTFIWMQGERDAKMQFGPVYESSLHGLHRQLSEDLGREDVHFVIGRLSDFDMDNESHPHWTMVRNIQVEVADSSPQFSWVSTDDLNDGVNRDGKPIENDLHYSADGYKTLGERFAKSSLKLIDDARAH
ncbi:MAG: hypothetical protein GY720_00105 [bacterium]|nr:hypothetical protein [bacterium]